MHAFDILGDPVRRRILELLAGGEHTSGDIVVAVQREFEVSVSPRCHSTCGYSGRAGSRLPALTVRAGSIRSSLLAFKRSISWLDRFRGFWEQRLDALGTEIARGKRKRRDSDERPS